MGQFVPGMQALIINSRFSENLGRVVVLDHHAGEMPDSAGAVRDMWCVKADQPLSAADRFTGEKDDSQVLALFSECCLIPVSLLQPMIEVCHEW